MVFGNSGARSGTGVAFTRNPVTGEAKLFGEYLLNAQGEDVVAGIRTPLDINVLKEQMPEVHQQFVAVSQKLETHYKDMQASPCAFSKYSPNNFASPVTGLRVKATPVPLRAPLLPNTISCMFTAVPISCGISFRLSSSTICSGITKIRNALQRYARY